MLAIYRQLPALQSMTTTITTLDALRETIDAYHIRGESVAFVPTMGALHSGHMALVLAARERAERVVVSIFVNPAQFGQNEDFSRYPRTLEDDLALLAEYGADAVWLPDNAVMYPDGFTTHIHVAGLSEGLCGAFRPGHFDGVATVVAKLLLQVAPDIACFGEKDYQQLCVIRRMVKDLDMPVDILGVPTVREDDGLALSSRNRYLSEEERKIAGSLNVILRETGLFLKNTDMNEYSFNNIMQDAGNRVLQAGFTKLDYLECRENDTLNPVGRYQPNTRLLVAAWLGNTRLIDNREVG